LPAGALELKDAHGALAAGDGERLIDGKPTRRRSCAPLSPLAPLALYAVDEAFTVASGEGAVRILELQRAGRQAMKTEDFLRGQSLPRGTRLT